MTNLGQLVPAVDWTAVLITSLGEQFVDLLLPAAGSIGCLDVQLAHWQFRAEFYASRLQ